MTSHEAPSPVSSCTFSLYNTLANFTAGKVAFFLPNWARLSSDNCLLEWISGVKIDFEHPVSQTKAPKPILFSPTETHLIQLEINRLEGKAVIERAAPEPDQFVSNIFARQKKDGTLRLILNLKRLNDSVEYHHFKMDTLATAIALMRPNCYMASVDLKDAYYSIPIHPQSRKYLRFLWQGQLYQFTCLPNGLSEAPRKFTKLLKIPFSHLRKRGFLNCPYLDDSYLQAQNSAACADNVQQTIAVLDNLGFTVHPTKSVLVPCQILVFLGFVLNSITMTVKLTDEKAHKLENKCRHLLYKTKCSIRELAEIIGLLVATSPGVEHAPVYYRRIDIEKSSHLKRHGGNFDSIVSLGPHSREDLLWWITHAHIIEKHILHPPPSLVIRSDSSDFAWGAVSEGHSTGGPWTEDERRWHINEKELYAAYLALLFFCKSGQGEGGHVRLELDNTTAVSYINNQGGRKRALNNLARTMWLWAKDRDLWLSAAHLPGSANCEADLHSRKAYSIETEWQLDITVFNCVSHVLGPFDIDLFASRLNTQLPSYVSWKPDPEAKAVDAFSISWFGLNAYIFPPFSLLQKVISKVAREEADVVVIAPLWPTQVWFPLLLHMSVAAPRVLPPGKQLLTQPTDRNMIHPLWRKMRLSAFKISGDISKVKGFQMTLPTSSWHHGETPPRNSIAPISNDGYSFAVMGKSIQCAQL